MLQRNRTIRTVCGLHVPIYMKEYVVIHEFIYSILFNFYSTLLMLPHCNFYINTNLQVAFIHPFIHSSIHLIIHPSIHLSIHSLNHSFIHPSIHSFNHPSVHPLNHSTSIHPFIHPFIHSSIHSSIHPSIHHSLS